MRPQTEFSSLERSRRSQTQQRSCSSHLAVQNLLREATARAHRTRGRVRPAERGPDWLAAEQPREAP